MMRSAISSTASYSTLAKQVQVFADDLHLAGTRRASGCGDGIATAQEVAALSADRGDVDVLVLETVQELSAAFSTLELNAPASPRSPVTRTSRMFFSGRCASSGCFGSPGFGSTRSVRLTSELQDVGQHLRVRTRRQGAFLGATQLGRRNHLHGLGDLPRVLHAADASPNVEYVCHVVLRRSPSLQPDARWQSAP